MKVCSPARARTPPRRRCAAPPRRRAARVSASSGGEELAIGAAQHVAHAGRLLPGAADQQVAPVEVLHGDARGGVLEDPLQAVGGDAQALLRAPLVGDVHARVDDVRDRAVAIEQAGARPRDQPCLAAGRQPLALGGDRELSAHRRRELPAHLLPMRREHVPGPAAEHVLRRAAGQALARAVEREDLPSPSRTRMSAPGRVDAGGEVALGLQRGLGAHPLGHVGGHAKEAAPRRRVMLTVTVIETRSRGRPCTRTSLPGLLALAPRDGDEDLGRRFDAELRGALPISVRRGTARATRRRRPRPRGSRACVRRRG